MYIRNRNDLISWLSDNAPSRAIARAMQEGQIENLGAFKGASPGSGSHWVVRARSVLNREWCVKIQPMALPFLHYGVMLIEAVPWKLWIGDQSENRLYRGDNPDEYKSLRERGLRDAKG